MAHCNTVFHQLLKFIPRHRFADLEKEYGTGRKARKFTRWNQFAALMFMQITARASLRDSVESLGVRNPFLYHLGLRNVRRSTFSDANNKRPASFFKALFDLTYQQCRPMAPKHKFRFKNRLYSMDATLVSLCLSLFPWAKFRRAKGGIRLHTLLDHNGYLPAFMEISNGKKHESRVAKTLKLPKGSIVAVDRAYTDYNWFASLINSGIYFVTRQKRNATYRTITRRSVNKRQGLRSDQTIILTGIKASRCPHPLRRVGYRDPQTGKHYVFLTNNFTLSAKTVCDIYKERWQIELFFKWIKQNLKIKAFIGNSQNAVLTQIYVALITYLLLAYLNVLAKLNMTLTTLIRILQLNLFQRLTFQELFKLKPDRPESNHNINQLTLHFC
ncbi:MAG: IS4 family transposase [Phycisphaerae bacterium]|nr:IS4 family transposase [Phycisphaerae bacterium]NIX27462.1 IS4 family transposase [Phycisphaerae bacterium]